MHLTIREQEKLMIAVASDVARKRKAKGLKLNYPEAMAIITDEMLEVTKYNDTLIEGNVDVKKNNLMFTSIAYDEGWKVLVDGKEVKTKKSKEDKKEVSEEN